MNEQANRLRAAGWVCSVCGCPGKKGFDCYTTKNRWVRIRINPANFRIIKFNQIIEAGHLYQLEEKMKLHDI
jgi:hypothetical protein